jgi:hypothetical protein
MKEVMGNLEAGKKSNPVFTAHVEDRTIVLKWSAATSELFDRFIIQRSSDGVNFSTIMVILGRTFSNETLNYDTTDLYPLSGHSFYRLRLLYMDGHEEMMEAKVYLE